MKLFTKNLIGNVYYSLYRISIKVCVPIDHIPSQEEQVTGLEKLEYDALMAGVEVNLFIEHRGYIGYKILSEIDHIYPYVILLGYKNIFFCFYLRLKF